MKVFCTTLLAEFINDIVEADFCAVSRVEPNWSLRLAKVSLDIFAFIH